MCCDKFTIMFQWHHLMIFLLLYTEGFKNVITEIIQTELPRILQGLSADHWTLSWKKAKNPKPPPSYEPGFVLEPPSISVDTNQFLKSCAKCLKISKLPTKQKFCLSRSLVLLQAKVRTWQAPLVYIISCFKIRVHLNLQIMGFCI